MRPLGAFSVDDPARLAVLISGRGSNMTALVAAENVAYRVVAVVSDAADADGLRRAAEMDVPTHALPASDREAALHDVLSGADVDLVAMAGFMRVLSPAFLARWPDRVLNIHPSLLPAFRGLDTHRRALEAGVLAHGCTAHLARPAIDDGPILGQALTAVRPGDDPAALGARVLALEHKLYPRAASAYASGSVRLEGGRVRGAPCLLSEL